MPCRSLSSSSCCARAPAMIAAKPAASGTGTPPMSRQWTSAPKRAIAWSASRPKLAASTSNVTRAPTWVNSAPSKSNPTAVFGQSPVFFSQTNLAFGSMKRRINHADATRSIHRCRRVAQVRRDNGRVRASESRPWQRAVRQAETRVQCRFRIGERALHWLRAGPGKKSIALNAATSRRNAAAWRRASTSSSFAVPALRPASRANSSRNPRHDRTAGQTRVAVQPHAYPTAGYAPHRRRRRLPRLVPRTPRARTSSWVERKPRRAMRRRRCS